MALSYIPARAILTGAAMEAMNAWTGAVLDCLNRNSIKSCTVKLND
jgi:hypothetical protein